MEERKKKDRDKVENMAPTKQTVHKKTIERIGSRRQKFKIEYDTVENVDRTGNELLANWKCLVQEKEKEIHTTSKKLQNKQPSKLSENRLREVKEAYMHNLQISIKDRLYYLRKQKQFLLDKQKTLNNVYKTIEKSNRSRIPNPFPQLILDVKRDHYKLFKEELLISSNGSINKYKRQIYAKEPSETILKLPQLVPDKEQTCIQEHTSTNRPGTSKLLPPLQILPRNIKKTLVVNKIRDEKKDKSKVRSTESMSKPAPKQPAPQQPAETTASNEVVDMNAELGSKRVRWKNKNQTVRLQKASRKNNYASDRTYRFSRLHLSSGKKCFIPKSKMVNERYCTTRKQNRNVGKQTDIEKIDRYPEPDRIHTLPRNMKETYIGNKIRKERKEKSKFIPKQSMSISAPQKTTANGGTLDMNSELALKRTKWENKLPNFRLQNASGKDRYISDRNYRFSRLHKSSVKNCYIPKTESIKVSKIVTEKYSTTRTQKRTVKKQTEVEKPDSYPAQDQIHTWSQNLKNIMNEKKDKSEVLKSMPLSAPQLTDETTHFNKLSTEQQVNETTAFNKMSSSTEQQADATTSFNKMSSSTEQQVDETTAFNKMSSSTEQQVDETTAFNKMSSSTEQQADETTAFNKMSSSTEQQADETTTFNKMSSSTEQQADATTAFNKMSSLTEQQADETAAFNKMSSSTEQQADETTAFNKLSSSTEQQADETAAFNKMSSLTEQQADETAAFNKMSSSTEQQADETAAFNKMSSSTEQQLDETAAFNKMSSSTEQQADETTAFNKMSSSTEQQADETAAFNKISSSTEQQAGETTEFNKMSSSTHQQTNETTAFNKMSSSTHQQTNETTAFNEMSTSSQHLIDDTTEFNKIFTSTQQQADETTASNTMSKSTQQQADDTTASTKMSKSAPDQTGETKVSSTILNSTRKQKRNVSKQTVREKSNINLEPYQSHSMLGIAVDDRYPTEDTFHQLDDNELIGFYQVQEKDLFPVIENMSDIKVIKLFKKLHDHHIAVIQSNTVDDIQSSSSGSTIDDIQDARENDGTLQTTMKTFVKKIIPDCITNGNQCQPTETLSSNWQIIKIRSGTNIKTRYIPMPPNTLKPKTSNARLKRYRRKMDENNNPPEPKEK
ncbi:uncharacterized protein LOC134721372 [Mytilus trossulus]|uniref:uncharacterized protein LOC134721372 n=1 Tax=Mytilus trossulus TaxID=6551 RepID=UPI00300449DA